MTSQRKVKEDDKKERRGGGGKGEMICEVYRKIIPRSTLFGIILVLTNVTVRLGKCQNELRDLIDWQGRYRCWKGRLSFLLKERSINVGLIHWWVRWEYTDQFLNCECKFIGFKTDIIFWGHVMSIPYFSKILTFFS